MSFIIRLRFFLWLFAFALIISSCSIEINQTTAITSTPPVESLPTLSATSVLPTTHTSVTWAHLNLTGKLVYLSSTMDGNTPVATIQILDLTTGDIATIFSAPPGGWIYYATISPDEKLLIMSYIPPSQSNSASNRILYSMALDGATPPQPLFAPPTSDDHYIQAE